MEERKAPGLIVALDCGNSAEAEKLVEQLIEFTPFFKVGLELFSSGGPEVVRRIQGLGARVFLDLKLHDIPNTVAKTVMALCALQPFMLTIHASGGSAMMRAAADAARRSCRVGEFPPPKLLGVTVLTSIEQDVLSVELGVARSLDDQVVNLAKLSASSGLDGVVASPREAQNLRGILDPSFLIVTPGIRPGGTESADQKRFATPGDAVLAGADFLVVGRPITMASDPRAACQSIIEEISSHRMRPCG